MLLNLTEVQGGYHDATPHSNVAIRRTASVLNDLFCHFLFNESDPGFAVVIWASLA